MNSSDKTYLIASQIKILLEEKGFTQNDVARLEGCSRQLVSQVINGIDRSKRITKRIAKLIDRSNLVILNDETQAELVKEYEEDFVKGWQPVFQDLMPACATARPPLSPASHPQNGAGGGAGGEASAVRPAPSTATAEQESQNA
ncbi:helix-turn-helix transcriptional regulator [Caldithrix abyssi]|nr:helix-turn-helix transcriptional regulator [Caldithrix abyssi]